MANDGAASLQCLAVRVSQLDATGKPATGLKQYVTDRQVKIDFNPDLETGPEISDRTAAGVLSVTWRLPDLVKRLVAAFEIIVPDPELEVMVSGGTTYLSGSAVMGFQYPALSVESVPNGVGIEAWTRAVIAGKQDPTYPYLRWVFPLVKLRKDNRTIDINRMQNLYSGFMYENPIFGSGPAKDIPWDTSRVAQAYRDTTYPTPQLGAQPIT